MVTGFQNLPRVPELRRRIGFTLMMLAVYTLAAVAVLVVRFNPAWS